MAIVDKLKQLIRNRGGETHGVQTIEDAANALAKMEAGNDNPLKGLVVDVSIDAAEDLLGKVVGDLQKDIVVNSVRGVITGTLKYVTGYTGFSGLEEEQEGHYIALHASVPDVEGVTIKATTRNMTVTLDSSGIHVLLIKPIGGARQITFTATKSGCQPISRTFDLTSLVLTPKATA